MMTYNDVNEDDVDDIKWLMFFRAFSVCPGTSLLPLDFFELSWSKMRESNGEFLVGGRKIRFIGGNCPLGPGHGVDENAVLAWWVGTDVLPYFQFFFFPPMPLHHWSCWSIILSPAAVEIPRGKGDAYGSRLPESGFPE